jgi:hypothetical protein
MQGQNGFISFSAVVVKIELGRKENWEKKQSIEEKHMFSAQCFAVSVAKMH